MEVGVGFGFRRACGCGCGCVRARARTAGGRESKQLRLVVVLVDQACGVAARHAADEVDAVERDLASVMWTV